MDYPSLLLKSQVLSQFVFKEKRGYLFMLLFLVKIKSLTGERFSTLKTIESWAVSFLQGFWPQWWNTEAMPVSFIDLYQQEIANVHLKTSGHLIKLRTGGLILRRLQTVLCCLECWGHIWASVSSQILGVGSKALKPNLSEGFMGSASDLCTPVVASPFPKAEPLCHIRFREE